MTTFELSNFSRFGYMGGRGGTSLSGQASHHHHPHTAESSLQSQTTVSPTDTCSHNHPHRSRRFVGSMGFCLKVLGLDGFVQGRGPKALAKAGSVSNPFNKGLRKNCADFWTNGDELGVNYMEIYDVSVFFKKNLPC